MKDDRTYDILCTVKDIVLDMDVYVANDIIFKQSIFEHFLNNISYKIHTNTWNNIYPTDNNNQIKHNTILSLLKNIMH